MQLWGQVARCLFQVLTLLNPTFILLPLFSMRKEKHSGSMGRERDKREKAVSVTRALSWLGSSTLSRRTRKLFHSHNDLNTLSHAGHRDKEKDDDDWVYEPQHYIGEEKIVCVCVDVSIQLQDCIARSALTFLLRMFQSKVGWLLCHQCFGINEFLCLVVSSGLALVSGCSCRYVWASVMCFYVMLCYVLVSRVLNILLDQIHCYSDLPQCCWTSQTPSEGVDSFSLKARLTVVLAESKLAVFITVHSQMLYSFHII